MTVSTDGSRSLSIAVSLLVDGGLAILFIAVFCFLRTRLPFLFLVRPMRTSTTPTWMPKALSWISEVHAYTDEEIFQMCGLDALAQILFFRFGVRAFSMCALLAVSVLIPVNWFASTNFNNLERTTMANIPEQSHSLLAHVFCAYLFTFFILNELKNVNEKYCQYRVRSFDSRTARARTVLVQGLPPNAAPDTIVDAFRKVFPDTIEAHCTYDTELLRALLDERERVLTYLERAEHDVATGSTPLLCRVHRLLRRRDSMDLLKEPLVATNRNALQSARVLFASPAAARAYWQDRLSTLDSEIVRQRELAAAAPALQAAFVTFASPRSASIAAQCNMSSYPGLWLTKAAPEPRDVIWANLRFRNVEKRVREFVVFCVVFGLFILYAILMTFAASVTAIRSLTTHVSLLDPINNNSWLRGLFEGVISSLIVLILISLLPLILSWLGRSQGLVSYTYVQQFVLRRMYVFFIVNVLFISLISGTVFDAVFEIIDHPASIITLLGQSVPQTGLFFTSYVMLHAFVSFPADLCNFGPLFVLGWGLLFARTPREKAHAKKPLESSYAARVSSELFVLTVGLLYASVCPIIVPFVVVFFFVGETVYRYQLVHVWVPSAESFGQLWPQVHERVIASILIYHIVLIILFALKLAAIEGPLLAPLPIITLYALRHFNRFYIQSVKNLPLFDSPGPEQVSAAPQPDEVDVGSVLVNGEGRRASLWGHTTANASYVQPELAAPLEIRPIV
eukprot:m.100846 g.100846  ORF g.100846 m.100846 type:complete len:737 (+) comp14077_c1_seq2:85-2295(+)